MADKQVWRRHYRLVREQAFAQATDVSAAMQRQLFSLDCFRQAAGILLFASHGTEPPTDSLIDGCLARGKRVALPRCGAPGEMSFFEIASRRQLSAGAFGISEPEAGCPAADDFDCFSLCVVPGLSFDLFGGRLGYGGGYYDRFLAHYPGHTAGLIFEMTLSKFPLPSEELDQKVEFLVTEQRAERVKTHVD